MEICAGGIGSEALRILHVTHQYRPALGGSEQHVIQVSEELARRGHRVDVYTTRSLDYRTWRNELPPREEIAGVNVRRFGSLTRRAFMLRWLEWAYGHYQQKRAPLYQPLILWGNGPISPGLFLNVLWRAAEYDVVHVNTLPYAHVWYTAVAAAARRAPLVITPFLHIDQAGIFDVACYNAALRRADVVMAMTGVERDYMVSRGVDPARIRIGGVGVQPRELVPVERGCWRSRFGIPAEAFAILFLARRAAYKGLDITLEAFAQLRQEDQRSVLLLAGPETEEWESLRQRYQGLPGLIDCGRVSDADKGRLLDACDVLVLPSTGESFGIVFVEAWMLGKPVIGARSGAVNDMIAEGEDGLLVAPRDAADLACKLAILRDQPELRRYLGDNGHRKAMRRYTVEKVSDDLEAIYRELAASHHREEGHKR